MENDPKYSKDYLRKSHEGCNDNKSELMKSDFCGCFFCLETYSPDKINWASQYPSIDELTICPFCGIDSVLSSKYPVADIIFLKEMNKKWF